MPSRRSLVLAVGISACLASIIAACATNPATGRRQLIFMSEADEIAIGKREAPKIQAEFGVYGDARVGTWFSTVTRGVANVSDRPDYPYTFTLLDSPVVNAFALPGGPVYATRGLLAHANSEAEIAGVMGHEVGHVIARHGAESMAKQQVIGSAAGLGSILLSGMGRAGDLVQLGAAALITRYSRDNEREADALGIKYMTRAGYDPRGLSRFMKVLDRLSEDSQGAMPAWLSTHPDPGERSETTARLAEPLVSEARAAGRSLATGEDALFAHVDGLVFADDPRHGFSRGRTFHHPELGFRFDAPEGWTIANSQQAVFAFDDPEKTTGLLQLTLVSGEAAALAPDAIAEKVRAQQGVLKLDGAKQDWNGLPAWLGLAQLADANGQSTTLYAGWVAHQKQVFQLLGRWSPERADAIRPLLERAMRSFRRETDKEVLGVKPIVIRLETLAAGKAIESVCARKDVAASCETVAVINQMDVRTPTNETRRIKVPTRQSPLFP